LGYIAEPFTIIMEYIPCGNLATRKDKLTMAQKQSVCLDVLRALVYMHNRKPLPCIHRDIKPQNILLTRSCVAKVADLGLSRILESTSALSRKTKTTPTSSRESSVHGPGRRPSNEAALPGYVELDLSTGVGTRRYAAPETATKTYDVSVDVYSSGIVFYELYEPGHYHPDEGLLWATAPSSVVGPIERMCNAEPEKRSSAEQAYDEFAKLPVKRTFGARSRQCVLM